MNQDRTQRIPGRVAFWHRSGAQRLFVVPVLTLVYSVTSWLGSALNGLSRDSIVAILFPDRERRVSAIAPTTSRARAVRALMPTPRKALAAGAALLGGILVATGLAAGSYAYLNAQATTPTATIKSGNLALTVQYGSGTAGATAALPTAAWSTMLPGDIVGQQFTITSTGTATSNVSVALSAVTAWDIRLAAGPCPTGQIGNQPLTTTPVFAGSLAGGASSVVCVQATLPAGAAAGVSGTTAPFTITLTATQVTP
jgi:hypothetical protein